jgi:hypothetical protein
VLHTGWRYEDINNVHMIVVVDMAFVVLGDSGDPRRPLEDAVRPRRSVVTACICHPQINVAICAICRRMQSRHVGGEVEVRANQL